MRIGVVGAGIVGVAVAHALLDERHDVTFLDPGVWEGRASDGNAGWIAHMDILPLASPKVWRNLSGWMFDPLGPLTVRPAYALRLAPWLLRFVVASVRRNIERSILAIRSINADALPEWQRLLGSLGLGGHLRQSGALSVWDDEDAFARAQAVISRQRSLGIPVETLDGTALRRLEPALGRAAVAGALYPTGAHVADPRALRRALLDRALARGAEVVEACATHLDPDGSAIRVVAEGRDDVRFDRVVVAAGAWSKQLAARLGDRIPLDTERGYNATFPPGTLGLARPVMFEGKGFVTTPLDIGDRVGGAVEFGGLRAPANHRRTDAIVAKLRGFLPHLPTQLPAPERWMGFRPSIPDSLPVIGPASRTRHVVYAFGHGHYGLTQAAVTARIVAALLAGRDPPLDAKPFSPARFSWSTILDRRTGVAQARAST
jgi:glycine/D-amino acid oxidase-like deaminating enzyme